jgi:hypothetical protein
MDLTALQVGDEVQVSFTVPTNTTDNLLIKRYNDIDLAIGPAQVPFDFNAWSAGADHYQVTPPPPFDPDGPTPEQVSKALPAKPWYGKHVIVAVRTSIRRENHFSQWSNRVLLDVLQPIPAPKARIEATKRGYLLSWPASPAGTKYQIFRRGPADKAPMQIGTTTDPLYLDSTSQWDTPYTYTVIAQIGTAQSEASAELNVNHADTFPPEIPSTITALAAPNSIEISWSRSPDANLKGYYVYRSTNGGDFVRVGSLVNVPSFSDTTVEHGKSYRYEVSALSQKEVESNKSRPTEPIAF